MKAALTFITFAIFYLFLCIYYYRRQNKGLSIGGAISKPKMFWLAYVLFMYFFMSCWLIIYYNIPSEIYNTLLLFTALIYCRFIIQIILLYIVKKWTPPIGIVFNIFCFAIIFVRLPLERINYLLEKELILLLYLIIIEACLLTDSYYAYRFYKIVGLKTKGENAIWFASEADPVFKIINLITARLNFLFYLAIFFLLLKIFFL